MKAMEAPKKIYLTQLMLFATPTISSSDNDVEYIQTDAFIEKAAEWIYETLRNTDLYENEIELMIDDFKKSMKL